MKRFIISVATCVLALNACRDNTGKTGFINERAALPESLKSLTVNQKFTTSAMNKTAGTMSVLYAGKGNLTLVTWKKKGDENWFGANVPDSLLTVEVLHSPYPGSAHVELYNCFDHNGQLMKQDSLAEITRIGYISSLKPSIFP